VVQLLTERSALPPERTPPDAELLERRQVGDALPAIHLAIGQRVARAGKSIELTRDIDERIVKDQHAAIPLQVQKFIFTRGSKVQNWSIQQGLGGYVDMAQIAVKH